MTQRRQLSTQNYVQGVLDRDRTILARAITLIESNAPVHQQQAQEVLRLLLPHTGGSIRVGITGVPGVGKSTFIEALGCYLCERDHRVAVLAVDPSSQVSKGSILGDKTRMECLSSAENSFIRPSPAGSTLGGVARKTRETMLLCEAAGFDVVLVETVGVGQSEVAVRSMVDCMLLLMLSGAGDELQGIKKGIVELADALLIHKADGDNRQRAEAARQEYARALHYLVPFTAGWQPQVLTCSSITGEGIAETWSLICTFRETLDSSGGLVERRQSQLRGWLYAMLEDELKYRFYTHPEVAAQLPNVEAAVLRDDIPVTTATTRLLAAFLEKPLQT